MTNEALIGWEVKVQWEDGDIEIYTIVDKPNLNNNPNEISYKSAFAEALLQAEIDKDCV